jgi:hypothetical protein
LISRLSEGSADPTVVSCSSGILSLFVHVTFLVPITLPKKHARATLAALTAPVLAAALESWIPNVAQALSIPVAAQGSLILVAAPAWSIPVAAPAVLSIPVVALVLPFPVAVPVLPFPAAALVLPFPVAALVSRREVLHLFRSGFWHHPLWRRAAIARQVYSTGLVPVRTERLC